MRCDPRRGAAALGLLLAFAGREASARTLDVTVGGLVGALAGAGAGDTLRLAAGRHHGPARVPAGAVLQGTPGAILTGAHAGSVIEAGAGSRIEDLTIRASGRDARAGDAGVRVTASGVTLRRLEISDVLYGVFAERADDLRLEDVRLTGRVQPGAAAEASMESSSGNGIHLWNCRGARVDRCDVARFMDGIYLSFAEAAHIRSSLVHDNGRYGLHTMYNQVNTLEGNRFTRNTAGCALMFSNGLLVRGNTFLRNRGPRTYGLLLKDCSGGRFENNRLVDNTIAVFMDNSNRNVFRGNLVQDNGWGLLIFSSSAKNLFVANDFVNDDWPVALDMRRTDNRFDDGRHGNFWSDARVHDLDGDGVGDVPHSPVSAFAFLSKRMPDLAVLAHSPAVAALTVAERVFPELRPSEAVDHFPRLRPVGRRDAGDRIPDSRPAPAPAAAGLFALLGATGAWLLARGRAA